MIACPRWPPISLAARSMRLSPRRLPFGTGGEKRNLDDPDRLPGRLRPGRDRHRREFRSARRQPHRRHYQLGELMPKRLELLSELVPNAKVIALLVNPNNAASAEIMIERRRKRHARRGCSSLSSRPVPRARSTPPSPPLSNLHADALLVSADLFFDSQREKLVALAARRAVPAIYILREYAAAGGLISYGPSVAAMNRVVGGYVGKILNGAKPADLPVAAADPVRAGHQPEDRQGARPHRAGALTGTAPTRLSNDPLGS